VIEAADPGANRLSFYNLLEAHVLRVATSRDAWLQRVRLAVETLRARAPHSQHPLLESDLFTASGYRSLFAQTVSGDVENLSRSGQLEFRHLLKRYLSRIDRDATGFFQLRPYHFAHVALNHRVSGGRPVILGTGILVKIVASRARAGESLDDLARNYQISRADVRDAIRYSSAA